MPLCGYTSSDLALLGHLPLKGKALEQRDKLKFEFSIGKIHKIIAIHLVMCYISKLENK